MASRGLRFANILPGNHPPILQQVQDERMGRRFRMIARMGGRVVQDERIYSPQNPPQTAICQPPIIGYIMLPALSAAAAAKGPGKGEKGNL